VLASFLEKLRRPASDSFSSGVIVQGVTACGDPQNVMKTEDGNT
jgi:hypothetical protein